MKKIRGTLQRSELEGGVWVFESEGGERYHLSGLPAGLESDGARLELEGRVDEQQMGIGMMGATFVVSRARRL